MRAPHFVVDGHAVYVYAQATLIVLCVMALSAIATLAAFALWAKARNARFGTRVTIAGSAGRVRPGDRLRVGTGLVLVRKVEGDCVFYDRVHEPEGR